MENNHFLKKTWWLKYPLFCLLAYPMPGLADTQSTNLGGEKSLELLQQKRTRTVVGTIIDDADESPIIGANIRIKNTQTGVISDAYGHFSLAVEAGRNVTIEISYIGYKTETIYLTDQGELNVRLKSDNEMLSEVVVVGSGTQKKISVTGAITSVKGTTLKTPSSSLTNSIAGKLPGIISTASSGEPGSTSSFYIRGISTFGGVATPLILLDGVEISASDLDRIPTESIESFTVLKDASATAIYGARGANGVMLVTTKEGELNQKARVNVNVEASLTQPTKMIDYLDGARWMDIYNEAAIARGGSAKYSSDDIDLTRSGQYPYRYPNVDWQDVMFKDYTWNERANVNVSGGGSKITYYMSIQANHDTGMLDAPKTYSYDTNINRWNYIFQNNLKYTLTSTTKVGLRMNAQIGHLKGPDYSTGELFNNARNVAPILFPATYPAREGDSHIRFGNDIKSGNELYVNPYAQMMSAFKEENYNTLNTVLDLEQNLDFITKGLKLTALVNFKNWSSTSFKRSIEPYYYRMLTDTWNPDTPDTFEMERLGDSGTDYISETDNGYNSNSSFYFDARLDYSRTFGDHSVSGMLMYMQRENRSGVRPNHLQGLSGRFTYDYKHKYLAEFNFGYNGTERLPKGERFEFFPAMSLGWTISEENFWEPIKDYISYFKLRGSYGVVGSDQMDEGPGHYLYVDNIGLSGGGYPVGFDGEFYLNGPQFNSFAVDNVCWERVNKLDIGIDLNLFDQLNITFDYFYDHRHRILQRRGSWPTLLGYWGTTPWSNIGKVNNRGVEISLNWQKELVKDLVIDLRGNFTYNHNEYEYYDEPNYEAVWKKHEGQPLSMSWGYIAEGYFKDQADIDNHADQSGLGSPNLKPGDIKYRDVTGDGVINSDDQVMLSPFGNMPRIQYGLGLNLNYKKIDFGVFFNGSAQRKIMINDVMTAFGTYSNNVMTSIADNHWTEQNVSAEFPRLGLTEADIDNNRVASSHWLRNGNFIRFKTLEVGYSFPKCRVYFSGDNLAVWSPFKYWDPEIWWNSYPLQRTFNVGIQINL